jgi:hypothetical protein
VVPEIPDIIDLVVPILCTLPYMLGMPIPPPTSTTASFVLFGAVEVSLTGTEMGAEVVVVKPSWAVVLI